MKNKYGLIIPAIILLLSFCICHFYLAFYNRFSSDDYYILKLVEEKGVFGAVKYFYFNWEGPYCGTVYTFSLAKVMNNLPTPFLANMLTVTALFVSLYIIFRRSLQKWLSVDSRQLSFLLMIVAISSLYYNDLAIGEVWYWMSGGVYLIFPAFFFLNFVVFYTSEKKYAITICYIFFFIFGSIRLNFSLIALAGLFIYFAVYFIEHKRIDKKTLIALLLLSAGLIIYIIAPGNYIRHSEFTKKISFRLPDMILNILNMSVAYVKEYFFSKFHWHVLFMLPVLYVGSLLKEPVLKIFKDRKTSIKIIFIMTVSVVVLILAQCFVLYVAKGGQTKRTLPMVNMVFVFYLMTLFLLMGALIDRKKLTYGLLIAGILMGSFLLGRRFQINRPLVKAYSVAADERIIQIKEAVKNYDTNKIDTLYLPLLPPSGWLHSGEIERYDSGDPMNNDFLMYYFDTKFIIDVERPELKN